MKLTPELRFRRFIESLDGVDLGIKIYFGAQVVLVIGLFVAVLLSIFH